VLLHLSDKSPADAMDVRRHCLYKCGVISFTDRHRRVQQAGPKSGIAPVDQRFETPRGQQLSVGTRPQARYLSKQKQSSEVDRSRPNKGVDPHPNAGAG
jgi:hypothetical protein